MVRKKLIYHRFRPPEHGKGWKNWSWSLFQLQISFWSWNPRNMCLWEDVSVTRIGLAADVSDQNLAVSKRQYDQNLAGSKRQFDQNLAVSICQYDHNLDSSRRQYDHNLSWHRRQSHWCKTAHRQVFSAAPVQTNLPVCGSFSALLRRGEENCWH